MPHKIKNKYRSLWNKLLFWKVTKENIYLCKDLELCLGVGCFILLAAKYGWLWHLGQSENDPIFLVHQERGKKELYLNIRGKNNYTWTSWRAHIVFLSCLCVWRKLLLLSLVSQPVTQDRKRLLACLTKEWKQ